MKVSVVRTGLRGPRERRLPGRRGTRSSASTWTPRSRASTRGRPPIYEPGCEEMLKRHGGQNLRATTDLAQAVRDSEI
jgi:UDP-glucose 6-dehydrogenase